MSILTTDFHTHIIPGIDDGSKTVTDSLEMLRKEQQDGVEQIVLTPHFYPQQMYPETFLDDRNAAYELLCKQFPENSSFPEIVLGAEVHYCPGMSNWEQLDTLTIGDSPYILIEPPFTKWGDSVFTELVQLQKARGLHPIIAHIERYLPLLNASRLIDRLLEHSVFLQMNTEFIINKRSRRYALKLINEKKIHFIGSDCHSPDWRSPTMAEAGEILAGNLNEQALAHLEDMQYAVLQK